MEVLHSNLLVMALGFGQKEFIWMDQTLQNRKAQPRCLALHLPMFKACEWREGSNCLKIDLLAKPKLKPVTNRK